MTAPRTIIHVDLDAFFCAVEEQREPSLRGKPFAVGGSPDGRGVVSSCSYPARRYGVHSAMPMARAVAVCPQLIIVPGNYPAYRATSSKVMDRLRAVTPLVEQISIDEAFLDVTDAGPTIDEVLVCLSSSIRDGLGLPCSLGVATNKLVAKIATEVGKTSAGTDGPPNAVCVVPPGTEAEFLAPLPAGALWGVGPKTAERLASLGLLTIGDIASWPESALVARFGEHGRQLARHARGIDERPVVTEHVAKSISKETTFVRDVTEYAKLVDTIRSQAASVTRRLRRAGLCATTVKLKLRWNDFTTITRQATLPRPTGEDGPIRDAAIRLLEEVWQSGRPVRLIGVGVSGLGCPPRQLGLWETGRVGDGERDQRLRTTLAALRDRFGDGLVRWGSELGHG